MSSSSRALLFLLVLLLAAVTARAETVALALSGGGARGFAHIGILQALEEEQIEPDLIVGCSMGAVVGGLYAAGYSAGELKNIALTTDWSDLFLDRPSRRNLFLAQKETTSRHIIALRFRGLAPDVPLALSSGQKLSDLLFNLTQRAPYQPWPAFDDLRIPFRAVATDLISGKPRIFDSGDLAEALRASISMPLVFSPYRMDTLALVDGGVTENIPVEIAIRQGADFVIAIDLSTGFIPGQTTEVPWELADRVTTLMHVDRNRQSREMADVVVTPDIGRHGSTEFTGIDSLIRVGYESMKAAIPELRRRLAARTPRNDAVPFYSRARYRQFLGTVPENALPPERYTFSGVTLVPDSHVARLPLGRDGLTRLAHLRRAYVDEGYTLAHATHLELRPDRTLDSRWQEGYIRSINVHGVQRHKPWTILREFPLRPGEVFELRRARRGVAQIYGSEYFDSVTLAVLPSDSGADLTIRVVERSTPQLRFGAGYGSERKGRGFAEFLNDNALGLNARLSLFAKYGERDEEVRARVIFDRLPIQMPFDRDLGLYTTTDFSVRWVREEYNTYDARHKPVDFYFFERTGADLWIGRAFRRWGLLSGGAIYEQVRTGTFADPRSSRVGPAVRTIVDTKDRYPFATRGIEVRGLYEYMWQIEEDDGAFNRVNGKADAYLPLARRVVVRGMAEYGWNDRGLPRWGQFQLGGEESLLGLHVAERVGNSKLSFLGEMRYDLLSRWIADAYLSAMYTAGAVSAASDPVPHDHDYQHGVGVSFALSTILGPMKFTAAELLRSRWSGEHFRLYINLGHEF